LTSKTEETEEQFKEELINPAVRLSFETNRFSAGHEISNILWLTKVLLATARHWPTTLSQISPVQALQSCSFLIYFNIIPPTYPMTSKWSLFFVFSKHNPAKAFLLFPMHATQPAHLIFLDLTTEVICGKR